MECKITYTSPKTFNSGDGGGCDRSRGLFPLTPTSPKSIAQGRPASSLRAAGFTLLEVMIASAIGLIGLLMVMLLTFFCGRSFVAMTNYVAMDQQSQLALDKMSREIRQAHRVTDCQPTSVSFLDRDKNSVTYSFDPQSRTLMRSTDAGTNRYLTGCDSLSFTNYLGVVISNTFDAYLPAHVADTRMIQVTWTCSGTILGSRMNSESVQSAKIVIRNND